MNRGVSGQRQIIRSYAGEMGRRDFLQKLVRIYLDRINSSMPEPGGTQNEQMPDSTKPFHEPGGRRDGI